MTENGNNSRDAKGRFLPGNTIGPGRGGLEAKFKKEIKEKLLEAISINMDEFDNIFSLLEPKDQMNALISLMKYAVPATANHALETGQIINVSINTSNENLDKLPELS